MKDWKIKAAETAAAKKTAMGCGVPGRKLGGRVGADLSPLSQAGQSGSGRKPK